MDVDTRELAIQALEEVELLGRDESGLRLVPDQPEGTAAGLRKYEPVPPLAALEVVMREAFWASLATDEGRPCRMRLGYKRGHEHPSPTEQRLELPVPLDRRTLRKFAAVHDRSFGSIVWEESADDDAVVRIVGFDGARSGREGRAPGRFAVAAPAPGALRVSWCDHVLISMSMGNVVRLSRCGLAQFDALGKFIGADLVGAVAPVLVRAIREIADSMHGGAIWLLPSGAAVRDVRVTNPIAGSRERYGGRHPADAVALVGKLASADGAVLVDTNLCLLAFGTFFEGPMVNVPVRWLHADGSTVDRRIADVGGTRHRSAAGFCVSNRPAWGIVVSQDGQVTVLVADVGRDDLRVATLADIGPDL